MRAAIVSCLVAGAVAVVIAACGGGSHSTTTTAPPVSTAVRSTTTPAPVVTRPRTNLQSLFEDENLLYSSYASTSHPGSVAPAFATLKALGVQRLRVFVPWAYLVGLPSSSSRIRPKGNPSSVDYYALSYWEYLDAIDRQAKASGIGLLFDVGASAPTWALGAHPKTTLGTWKPNDAYFGDLMHAMGERYSGSYTPAGASSPLPRVSYWSVWNEPNAVYLTPDAVGSEQTPYSARLYRGLVDAAWSGLTSSGHTPRTDTILIGETAPRGVTRPGNSSGEVPLTFIRAMYCVSSTYRPLTGSAATTLGCPSSGSVSAFRSANPGLFAASGWADHPYSDTTAPDVELSTAHGGNVNDADFASLSNLEAALDAVQKAYGSSARLPIYSTEYGFRTNPPTSLGLPDATAAAYMNEAEYLSWINPRIRSYSQYLLTDPGAGNDFDTGIETNAGAHKPDVYDAYRMPLWLPTTEAAKQAPLTVWGCVRPVNDEHVGSASVDIQFAIGRSRSYTTVKRVTLHPATGGCYFSTSVRFDASGTVRLSYRLAGAIITSRTQSITLH